jgi:membrane protein
VQLRERQEVEALPRRLLGLARAIAADYGRTGTSQFAAAISYRALFSLVPLATFVVTVAGLFLRDDSARQRFVDTVSQRLDLSTSGVSIVDRIVTDIPSPWSLVGLIALGVALWGATGVMSSVRKAIAVIFDDGVSYGFARGKLVDAGLVVGVLLALLLVVGLSVLEQFAARASRHVERALDWQPVGVGFVLGTLVPALLTAAVFALLYRYLPRHGPAWRAALIGAVGAAIACQAIQYGMSWYLAGPADFTRLYGSAGAVLAFLLLVYLSAVAFLVGALTASRIGRWEPQ